MTDFRNLERQMGQLASNQNTRHAGALPSDTEKNSQVNAVALKNGRELEEVPKNRRDKPIPEGELIPKATHESKKDDTYFKPNINTPHLDSCSSSSNRTISTPQNVHLTRKEQFKFNSITLNLLTMVDTSDQA